MHSKMDWFSYFNILLLLQMFALPSTTSKDICIHLTAKFATLAPDGVSKEVITINDQHPGPTIRARIGDRMTIRLRNLLYDRNGTQHKTSIHFHGIEMKSTPWMDGPEQVTQCPIPYGGYKDYVFTLLQTGTYWWHSHHEWQYIDGFWGFFIVDNVGESETTDVSTYQDTRPMSNLPNAHKYHDELHLSLTDWHWRSGSTLTKLLDLPQTANWTNFEASEPPIPDSALINGWGNANCTNATSLGFTCDESVPGTITVLDVIPCYTYRVRVLNPSARASFNFSIQGHKLRVIEVDGVDTVEVGSVDQVRIWPAQRYSFLVTMNMDTTKYGQYALINATITMAGPPEHDHLLNERLPLIRPLAALRYWQGVPPMSSLGEGNTCTLPGGSGSFPDQDKVNSAMESCVSSAGGGGQGRPSHMTPPWHDTLVHQYSMQMQSDSDNNQLLIPMPPPVCTSFRQVVNNADKLQERVAATVETQTLLTPSTQEPDSTVILDQSLCYPLNRYGNETEAVPQPQVGKDVLRIEIQTRFGYEENSFPRWYVNNVSYSSEGVYVPAIVNVMQGRSVPNSFVPFNIPLGQVVELVVHNKNGSHPIHLHGHTFWILGTGKKGDGAYNPNSHTLDLSQGIKRDTTYVEDNSWTVLRFVTNNPGVWLMHCHIQWHFHHGYALVFVEGEEELRTIYPMPKESRKLCWQNDVLV